MINFDKMKIISDIKYVCNINNEKFIVNAKNNNMLPLMAT